MTRKLKNEAKKSKCLPRLRSNQQNIDHLMHIKTKTTHTLSLIPKSCRKVQYDLRKYVSFFKSIPSCLDGEFSSISFLEKYHRPPSSGFSWDTLLNSDTPKCEESPETKLAILYLSAIPLDQKNKGFEHQIATQYQYT